LHILALNLAVHVLAGVMENKSWVGLFPQFPTKKIDKIENVEAVRDEESQLDEYKDQKL